MSDITSIFIPLYQIPGWILVAIGFYTAFRINNFPDLTVDASFVAGAVGAAFGAVHLNSSLLGLIVAIFLSGLAGASTAIIYLSNPRPVYKLLSGVLVIFIYYSVVYRMMGAKLLKSFSKQDTFFNILINWESVNTSNDHRPVVALIGLFAIVLVIIFLKNFYKTNYGLKIRAVATRPNLIANKPMELAFIILPGLVISNIIVGIGGWYHASCTSVSQIIVFGFLIHGLAASLLGEMLLEFLPFFKGRKHSMTTLLAIPVIGSIVYFIVRSFVTSVLLSTLSNSKGTEFSINLRDTDTIVAGAIVLLLLLSNFIRKGIGSELVEDESQM